MAQQVLQQGSGGFHLGVKVGLVQLGELHMVKGVDADLMAFPVHPTYHILVVGNLAANEEKGGRYTPLRQTIQQAGGGGAAGTVVKGEGDELLLRKIHGGIGAHRIPIQ